MVNFKEKDIENGRWQISKVHQKSNLGTLGIHLALAQLAAVAALIVADNKTDLRQSKEKEEIWKKKLQISFQGDSFIIKGKLWLLAKMQIQLSCIHIAI